MTYSEYFLLFLLILYSLFYFMEIIRKEKKHIFTKVLIVIVSIYFFIVYLPKSANFFDTLALVQLLLILLLPISILFVLIIYINNLRKEKRFLDNFTIIVQYEPPSNIHPAIAGFLIDKKIGKREFFATLFDLIIKGHIVVDERIENDGYKYYLLKNKGFDEIMTCNRMVCDYIFYEDNKYLDSVSMDDLKINSGILSILVIDELVKLKYFKDPYIKDPYSYVFESRYEYQEEYWEQWIKRMENRFSSSIFLSKKNKERARKEIEYQKIAIKEYVKVLKNKPAKNLGKQFKGEGLSYTKLGAEERAKWLGFKDYLQTAERFRLDEEKVETFSKYLPYAVALGVETEWAERFENMKVDKLEWFRAQKEGDIIRHDDHNVYFKHLIRFMGRIYTK